MKKLCPLLICALLFACSTAPVKVNEAVELVKIKTIKIRLDSMTSQVNPKYQYVEDSDKRLFVFFNRLNTNLYIYNYDTEALENQIPFEKEGPNGVGSRVRSFYYHNGDSVFVHSFYKNKVLLFNAEAELINSYELINDEIFGVSEPITGHSTPMTFYDGKLYLNNGGKCNNTGQGPIPPNFIEIDLKTGQSSYHLSYPQKYYNNEDVRPGTLCNLYNTTMNSEGQIAFGYALSHDIYFTSDFQEIKIEEFSSHIVLSENHKPKKFSTEDQFFWLKAGAKYAQYGALYFDPYRKFYLRFANTCVPDTRLEKKIFKPDQNIIIKSSEGKYIGEVSDFEGSYFLFFTQEGLNQVQRDNTNEDILNINVYDYKLN